VASDIHEICRLPPRRWRIMVVRDAKGDVLFGEEFEDGPALRARSGPRATFSRS
jgi:hypothetical protein